MLDGLRIFFLASEANPLVKIGGLGDVAGSLPKALCNLPLQPGSKPMDVRQVIPFHGAIQRQAYSLSHAASLQVPYQDGTTTADLFSLDLDGLPVYLISGPIPGCLSIAGKHQEPGFKKLKGRKAYENARGYSCRR
jgi:starch synthase